MRPLALALMASLLPGTAAAGVVEDCTQDDDWWLRIEACTDAIESDRWSGASAAWAYSNRAVAYAALGEYLSAFDDHEQAVRLDPGDARARNNKANSHADFREYERALAEYAAAIRLDPGYINAYFNRADVYLAMGRDAEAEADFTTVLAAVPDVGEAHAGRAAARCRLGDVAGSVEDRRAAVALGGLELADLTAHLSEKGYLDAAEPDDEALETALTEWTAAGCP